jgi:hypothetical protein
MMSAGEGAEHPGHLVAEQIGQRSLGLGGLAVTRQTQGGRPSGEAGHDRLCCLRSPPRGQGDLETKVVARRTGLSIDQARNRLQALGLLPPRQRRRVANRQRILDLRTEGLWPLEIARRSRIQPQLVRKILWQLRRQRVIVPTPSRPRPIKRRKVSDDRFLRARRRGGTPAQIAERLHVSRAYMIHKTWHLRRRGLIAPVPRPRINRNG